MRREGPVRRASDRGKPIAASQPVIDPVSVRIPEAVRFTGLSRSRLYELIKSGDIEIIKVGASTLVLVESLRAFVERCRSNG